MRNAEIFSIEAHESVNHKYGEGLPYAFHLRMVNRVAKQFSHLLDNTLEYFSGEPLSHFNKGRSLQAVCLDSSWAHDLIEDARLTYNDVKDSLGIEVAEVVYALTNEKGRTRAERANEKYYQGIKSTKGATFVKLCDRIANVQYSQFIGSRMFEMYKKEQPHFEQMLRVEGEYTEMWDYLNSLYK
mgnify:CR=1 FL=1